MALDYPALLRQDADRFAQVLDGADPAARVPTCPDWDADDLLWHLAEVFLFWGAIVRNRLDSPDAADAATPDRPGERAELRALYGRAAADLLAALDATADDVPVWTWSDDHSAGFVRRRMAHEALIHRLDAELVAGAVTGIDPAFAADGVHEALQHVYGGYPEWARWDPSGPVGRLRATDTGDEWLVQVGGFSGLSPNTGKTYADEPSLELVASGEPAFTLSATARDLDAWVWNRPALREPTVEGSGADFEAFRAVIAKGVQ